MFCLMNFSGLSMHSIQTYSSEIFLLSMPCLSDVIFLLYLYPFLVFVSQIKYWIALHVNTFLRPPNFYIFAAYLIYSCFRICGEVIHLINPIVQLYYRFMLISKLLLCYYYVYYLIFSPAELFCMSLSITYSFFALAASWFGHMNFTSQFSS